MALFVRSPKLKESSGIIVFVFVFLLSTFSISDGNPVTDDEFLVVPVIRSRYSHVRPQIDQIYQIDLATGRSRPLLNTETSSPTYLAIDRKRQMLYYVVRYDEIDSVSLTQGNNDSMIRVIFTDPTSSRVHLNGLAIDDEREKLYFSDVGFYPRIVEIDLLDPNGTRRLIVSGHSLRPKAIVIDEVNSEMYWTDCGRKPGIFVISLMEPQNVLPQTLVADDIVTPNALAIDFNEEVMYWVDDHHDRIELSNLYGQDRRTLVQNPSAGVYYFAMAISPQFLYITDQTTSTVLRVDRSANITELHMPNLTGRKSGIAYYNSNFTNVGRAVRRHTYTYVAADERTTLSTSNGKTETERRVRTIAPDKTTLSTTHGKVEAERLVIEVYESDGEIVIALFVVLVSIFLFIVIIVIISLAIWCDRRRHRRTAGVSIAFGYYPVAVACDEMHSSRGRLLTEDVYIIKDISYEDDLPEDEMPPSPPTKRPESTGSCGMDDVWCSELAGNPDYPVQNNGYYVIKKQEEYDYYDDTINSDRM